MSASLDNVRKAEAFQNESDNNAKSPKKLLRPISCTLGSRLNFPVGCEVEVYGSELTEDAPMALYLGDGAACVCSAGVRTLQLTFTSACASHTTMLEAARRTFAEVFKRAREQHSKGVYLIGHGVGALFAAKLLADKQFFEECPSSHLLQAAFLISGIYDLTKESVHSLLGSGDGERSSSCGSPPKFQKRKPSLLENLVSNHQSFDDRTNLSFICDMTNQIPQFEKIVYGEDLKKCKPVHGIQLTAEETLKNSPVFQQVAELNAVKIECNKSICNIDYDVTSSSLEEIKILKMLCDDLRDFSPLFDNFKHLKRIGMRVYVFAAEKDGPSITKQSRDMFDCLADGCDQEDMQFQVKEKVDRTEIRELLRQEDNFLKRLMRYDIVKHL